MTNKEIVLKAMNELFHEKDSTAIERHCHEAYQQHHPAMINDVVLLTHLDHYLSVYTII